MNPPEVTVVIPVYNEEIYLKETIESVLNQSEQNILVHISDNCSTDRSLTIIKAYASQDPRIICFEQKETLSAHENSTFLIQSVQTKFTFILGGHDVLHEECIAGCLALTQNDKVSCVFPTAKYIGTANKTSDPNSDIALLTESKFDRYLKMFKNLKSGTAVYSLYRTEVLKKVDIEPILGGDLNVLFQVAQHGSILCTKETLFFRRENRVETLKGRKKRYLQNIGMRKSTFGFERLMVKLMSIILADSDIKGDQKLTLYSALMRKFQAHVIFLRLNFLSDETLKTMPLGHKFALVLKFLFNSLLFFPVRMWKLFNNRI